MAFGWKWKRPHCHALSGGNRAEQSQRQVTCYYNAHSTGSCQKRLLSPICVGEWTVVCVCAGICQTSQSQWLCKVLHSASAPLVNSCCVFTWFVTKALTVFFTAVLWRPERSAACRWHLNLSLHCAHSTLHPSASISLMMGLILQLIQHVRWNYPSSYIWILLRLLLPSH